MKKSGFTLAEVLITLGIIGVVAALTTPALVTQSRNQANAAKLAVAVSNLENAFHNAILTEGVDNLNQTQMFTALNGQADRAGFVGQLKRYLNVSDFDVNQTARQFYAQQGVGGAHRMTANGGRNAAIANDAQLDGNMTVETKQGSVVFVGASSPNAGLTAEQVATRGGGLSQSSASIVIDVNGTSAPNTFGRDIFFFELGNNGVLYPWGSVDYSVFRFGGRNNVWTGGGDTGCTNGSLDPGLACTGRVIAEGYNMNY